MLLQVLGRGGGDEPRGFSSTTRPTMTEGPSHSQGGGALYKNHRGEGPPGSYISVGLLALSLRGTAAFIEAQLVNSVHPNPGPGRRGRRSVVETGRRERNARRYERRRARRLEIAGERRRRVVNSRGGRGLGDEIVTWNVQGMSVRGNNRDKMRRVTDRIIREGWEIVCLTEISAERDGVVWMGEDEFRVVFVHGMKSGVLLRGGALESWIREGQCKWTGERVTAVVCDGMRVVSVYQPVWGTNEVSMIEYRRDIGIQLALGGRERLVIGGDFNANVGRGYVRRGVCGKFGVGRVNEAGADLIDWCEENELAYVNSYMKHRRRGTWFNMRYGRWYELDGFVVRKRDRVGMVVRMRTISEWGLSDHRPKVMRVKKGERRWRTGGAGNGRAAPNINWEVLQGEEKKEEYKERTRRLWDEENWGESAEQGDWGKVCGIMMRAAKEVCGVREKRVSNPWEIGREEEIEELMRRVNVAVNERNACLSVVNARRRLRVRVTEGVTGMRDTRSIDADSRLERARMEVRSARKEVKRFISRIEREWWCERIRECREACDRGRIGDMYKCLRRIGTKGKRAPEGCMISVDEFKRQFEAVSKDRYEVDRSVIERAVAGVEDLRTDERAMRMNEGLNMTPGVEEIVLAMREMKDTAPGEDGVRLRYISEACEEVRQRVVEIVRWMFETRAGRWDDSAKSGIMVPLFKKGDRRVPGNYRGVCLLSMSSRVLARVIARRVSVWAEGMGLLDDNQAGFRSGRSTADVVQMMVRVQEDVDDCRRRVNDASECEWPVAKLLDLRKAYPRVSKPGLWSLLERYGMNGKCLECLIGLHEGTVYKVRGKEGMSEAWVPARGLREGCSTSPILFNIYHQAVMRQADTWRCEQGGDVGVPWRWVPGGSFAGGRVWEKGGAECRRVSLRCALFADDTTVVGMSGEIERGSNGMKEVMGYWEESINEDKEEELCFGTSEGGGVRVLGSWMSAEVDVKNRIKRANGLWWKVRGWLVGSKLSKRWQARVVEACVESSLLYDSGVRVWYKKDLGKLQKWMDKCYRYVWSDRNGEPLRQMEARGCNMQDVRSCLGVKSVRWKIEKRVLERIGHVVRMGNDRLVKAMVLGWYEGLEGKEKMIGRKRKTVLYWKRILNEAGVDWTDVERVCLDRDGWRAWVRARMVHVDKWERQGGHGYVWGVNEERVDRNDRRVIDLVCRYDGCGKVCRSKGGLVQHQKRRHRAPLDRVVFDCGLCGRSCETEVAKINHERSCGGGRAEGNRRECAVCGSWVSRGNYARHRRACVGVDDEEVGGGTRTRGRTAECQLCGRTLSYSNMARHQRSCRVWDPGGG